VLGDLLRFGRHAPDRLLHRFRRRAAWAEIARRPPPDALLVVCHGNICRSPFAAAVLRSRLAGTGIRVESAGFFGPGRASPATAVEAARQRRQDLRTHRARLLTPELVRTMDLIAVMDLGQRRAVCERFGRNPRDVFLLGDFDPLPIRTRAVRDPVERPLAVFDEVYERLERCSMALADAISAPLAAAAVSA